MLFLWSLFALFRLTVCSQSPMVQIEQGQLVGVENIDWKGGKFYSFLSVPYAKNPEGDLRFKDPEPPENWDGIYEANVDMPMCTQFDWEKNIVGQENCLFLNIHSPDVETTDLKPVMVFIHGGAYIEGNGRYEMFGPEFLMPEGVILVTVHYRLGLFGFLNFDNPAVGVPGNAGLKDQNFALRWVQKNIIQFGGNPDNVTIFGESAGGASVHHHLLSPLSNGLFHKVIAQSGTALNTWNGGMKNTGVLAAEAFNVDEKTALDYLQCLPVEILMEIQKNSSMMLPIHEKYLVGPIVEEPHGGDVFLSETPNDIITKGNFNKVPFMLGYNNNEAIITDVIQIRADREGEPLPTEMLIPHTFGLQTDAEKQMVIEHIFLEYNITNYENATETNRELNSDLWINYGVYRSTVLHSNAGHEEIYFYKFSGDTSLNYMKLKTEQTAKIEGASHVDELGYLFKNEFTPINITADSIEGKCIEKMVKLWTNFAKFGNPAPDGNELDITWPPVKDQLDYLDIGTDTLIAKVNPLCHAPFWNCVHAHFDNKKKKIGHDEFNDV